MELTNRKIDSYSYSDYAKFDANFKCEIIWGEVIMMSPAPSFIHQDTIGKLFLELSNIIPKECKVILSPIDVFLDFKHNINECKNIVQPDIAVVCNKDKINYKGLLGTPDIIIEIVSPSSLHHDTITKYKLYENYEVKEYWMIFPEMKTVVVNTLEGKLYKNITFNCFNIENAILKSLIYEEIFIDLHKLFD